MLDSTGIYAIENLRNLRVYVGATKNSFLTRRKAHFRNLHQGWHSSNLLLGKDAELHGACAFRFIILQELPRDIDYAPFEQFWMEYLMSLGMRCYNVMRADDRVSLRQRRAQAILMLEDACWACYTAGVHGRNGYSAGDGSTDDDA